jgi:mRNA interferase MazF
MTKPTNTFECYEVVKIPFPFADTEAVKVRPALILSSASHFNCKIGCSIMTMITSVKQFQNSWPTDVLIEEYSHAGLPVPSLVRFKLFTLDHRLILNSLGVLSVKDRQSVQRKLKEILVL